MSEVYPSDNELLNILSDSQTGVEYISTGKSPYYLEFRKMLYRLILAAKKANDFRVFDEGGLNIGVKGGKFWLGTTLIQYAGSSGNVLADNKSNIYVYINASGNLVINEYSQFPTMSTTPHLRLAIITTSGGDVTSITDARCNYYVPGV
jgi:hypothetical protein